MSRNKVYAIVEGHGETQAISELLARLLHEMNCWTLFPSHHIYRLRSGGDFFIEGKLENVLRTYKEREDCAAVFILVDVDEACPKERACDIAGRIQQMERLPFSVVVICPKPEYEAWFLSSLESIHPGRSFPDDPETRRDAKGWLRQQFDYRATYDQKSYTQRLDVNLARQRSRSFRRLYHAVEEVVTAAASGDCLVTPARCENRASR
jgi:hypothetical protein